MGFIITNCIQGNRTNYNRIKHTDESEVAPNSDVDSSVSSSFPRNNYPRNSQALDTTSLINAPSSEYEEAESGTFVLLC